MTTAAASIQPPVIEPILLDASTISIRLARVPNASIDASLGGYRLYRSLTRSGFAGALNTDFFQVVTGSPIGQPAATSPFVDVTLTGQPSSVTLYYRAAAFDNLTTPTMQSRMSNVITFQQLSDRRTPIPAWPADLFPNQGVLKGLVLSFQDSDPDAGLTWHEIRQAMATAEEFLEDELRMSLDEGTLFSILRNPPPALRSWFENLAASLLIDRMALQAEDTEKRREQFLHEGARWRDELYDDDGSFLIPGGGSARTGGVRVVR